MGSYYQNRKRAQTITDLNKTPSLTEQSLANDTDINIIVQKFRTTGRVPAAQNQPMAGDFTHLPTDLRGFIETAKSIKETRRQLPPQLRDMPMEELLTLTHDKLTHILTPAPKPDEEKK